MNYGIPSFICSATGLNGQTVHYLTGLISANAQKEAIKTIEVAFFDKYGYPPSSSIANIVDEKELLERWIKAQDFFGDQIKVFGHPVRSRTGFQICGDRFLTYNIIRGEIDDILPDIVANHPPNWASQRPIDRIISSVMEMFDKLPDWKRIKAGG